MESLRVEDRVLMDMVVEEEDITGKRIEATSADDRLASELIWFLYIWSVGPPIRVVVSGHASACLS